MSYPDVSRGRPGAGESGMGTEFESRPPAPPDLATWLLEQIAEDERIARSAVDRYDRWVSGPEESTPLHTVGETSKLGVVWNHTRTQRGNIAAHIARWDPDRVLAECEAKRRIIDLHKPLTVQSGVEVTATTLVTPGWPIAQVCEVCADCDSERGWVAHNDDTRWPCPTLRAVALPYAGREGYREEWRP